MYEGLNTRRKVGAEQGLKLLAGFDMLTKNPMAVQTKLLMELLQENKDTEYGKKYGFGEIKTIEEYQEKVPVTEYDHYAQYIDRMSDNGERSLISSSLFPLSATNSRRTFSSLSLMTLKRLRRCARADKTEK